MESGNWGGALAIAGACAVLGACGNPNEPSRTVALQITGDVKTLGADLRIGGGVGGAEVTLLSGGSFSFPRTYVIVTADASGHYRIEHTLTYQPNDLFDCPFLSVRASAPGHQPSAEVNVACSDAPQTIQLLVKTLN